MNNCSSLSQILDYFKFHPFQFSSISNFIYFNYKKYNLYISKKKNNSSKKRSKFFNFLNFRTIQDHIELIFKIRVFQHRNNSKLQSNAKIKLNLLFQMVLN